MIDLTFSMTNADCDTISDDDNMVESCIRRLNTIIDTTLYEEYGSTLRGLLGRRKSEVNLQFLEQTINECLMQDERISDSTVECEYTNTGVISDISIVYEDNELRFDYEVTNEEE